MKAIFAGTFDPFTLGHKDIARRAAEVFGEVIVAVACVTGKSTAPIERRVKIAELSVSDIPGVTVMPFEGLLTDFAESMGCNVLVRGVRSAADLEYERELTRVYASLSGINSVILLPSAETEHISSTTVRTVVMLGGDIGTMVAPKAAESIKSLYAKRS